MWIKKKDNKYFVTAICTKEISNKNVPNNTFFNSNLRKVI